MQPLLQPKKLLEKMMQSDESDEVALDTEKDEGIGRKNSEDLKDNSSVRLKLLNH